jgi:serine/threonine-protein kinase SRK2
VPLSGDSYRVLGYLGQGSNGLMLKAVDLRNAVDVVAVKLVPRSSCPSSLSKYIIRDVVNHSKLAQHPHITCLREVFLTEEYVCLAMEYANSGNLQQLIKSRRYLDEHLARRFFQQLILAVDYCHQLDMCSCDITVENVLLTSIDCPTTTDDSQLLVKLGSFGYSRSAVTQFQSESPMVGNPAYMSPEVIASQQGRLHAYNGKAADMWACGVTLFAMLYGVLPFAFSSELMREQREAELPRICARMQRQELCAPPDRQAAVSDPCYRLLARLLEPDPRRRITARQVFAVPWFNECLPPGTAGFNAEVIRAALPPAQSEEEIVGVLQHAMQPAGAEEEQLPQ